MRQRLPNRSAGESVHDSRRVADTCRLGAHRAGSRDVKSAELRVADLRRSTQFETG
jgi:hypothetical protein